MADLPKNPLLAANADLTQITYPIKGLPKVDGVRGMVKNGVMYSRRLKPFPNKLIHQMVAETEWPYGFVFDGEIVLGNDPCAGDRLCNRTSGALMRSEHEGPFTFWLFDFQPTGELKDMDYQTRFDLLHRWQEQGKFPSWVQVINGVDLYSEEELQEYEERWVGMNYEGMVLRKLDGRYKNGRSTEKQALLLRVTRSERREARIIGFCEAMANENTAKVSETGHTERSTMKSGMRPKGVLGAFRVVGLEGSHEGEEFTVGTGMDDTQKTDYWNRREELMGQMITYSFKPHGSDKKPRFPVFKGFRSEIDL